MRVFMTGATGYIGGSVAAAARNAGHEVLAAAHEADAAARLAALGIESVLADLTEPGSLARYAKSADAIIHAGFAAGPQAGSIDRRATEALVAAAGRRPVIYTSGVWVLGPTEAKAADEHSPTAPINLVAWRGPLERWLTDAARNGAHTVIIRPGVAWGHGGGIPGRIARGELPLVGNGEQRWSVVHVDDLATLYLAAAERGRPGAILHGVGEVVVVRDLLRAEGNHHAPQRLDITAARERLGAFADALAIDQDVSATFTRRAVGWNPTRFIALAPDTGAALVSGAAD